MPKLKYIALLLALVFLPAVARAAHDTVTHSSDISIYLSDRGQSYTLDATSQLESYSVDTGTVSFVVSSGSLFQLSYAGKVKFVPSAHTCTETNVDCDATNSYVSINCASVVGTPTITVSVSSCGGGGGGGGGGSGGGDTTPPASASVSINSNAVSTANANVTLSLSASDTSLPMQMMISNDSDFTGRSWEGYSVIKSWTLTSGAGVKTVYAKFKDSAGNVSSLVSDTITLLGTGDVAPTQTPTPTPTPTPTVIKTAGCPTLAVGNLVMVNDKSSTAVWVLDSNLNKVYFPNESVYKTWYAKANGSADWSMIKKITPTCLEDYSQPASGVPQGVNYFPGSTVFKLEGGTRYYVTEAGDKKTEISEAAASKLFGSKWKTGVKTYSMYFSTWAATDGVKIETARLPEGSLVKKAGGNAYQVIDGKLNKVDGALAGAAAKNVRTVSDALFTTAEISATTIAPSSIKLK